ncbi:hypothetical protein HMPREF3293_02936 [Christensenella minuta]|uniref:Uncharacterized protein n=1 Tax=Christensenella minuta TaxID=626937 RepID=A0A136Q0Y8_9FIRM|nr:hypothetical protein HMPREF3293_02936 [Christensenella minuta]
MTYMPSAYEKNAQCILAAYTVALNLPPNAANTEGRDSTQFEKL